MDGGLIAATISSIVVIGGAVVGGFVRQSNVIGRLEGKFDGLKDTVDTKLDGLKDVVGKTFDAHDHRITRLENITNNLKPMAKKDEG